MDSRSGKKIRLGRIVDPTSGRTVIVAASHGVLTGAPRGLGTVEDMNWALGQLDGANGVMVAPGAVRWTEDVFVGRHRPSLVVHLDWKSHGRDIFTPGESGRSEGTLASLATIEQVVGAGADAVMSYLYVGQQDSGLERAEVERNARLAAECDRLGIVLIIEPRSTRDYADRAEVEDVALLAWYCRMSAEIGADVVKCIWPGSAQAYEQIAAATPVPLVLAGGSAGDDRILETMRMARDAVKAGGAGVMFGRRIYGSASPRAVLAALRSVVHEGASAEDGVELFRSLVTPGDV